MPTKGCSVERSRSWRGALIFGFLVGVIHSQSSAQVVLYDNLDNVRFADDWLTPLGPDRKYAQQFLTNDNANVDQVTVLLQRPVAGATGSVSFELWKDNGSNQPMPVGDDGRKVADLGKVIDVTQVPVGEFGEFTFDNLLLNLQPNSSYWVVADFSKLRIISGEQSVGWAANADPHPKGSPPDYDAAAGTNKAAHAHHYRSSTPFWQDITVPFGLKEFYMAMAVEAMENVSDENVSLYNNMSVEPFPFHFDTTIGPRFDSQSEALAQQFNSGASNNLSSVSLHLQRVGSPTGNVAVELWDDNGMDRPSEHVATIGTFDVSSLDASQPQLVTFDSLITGLNPGSSYFIVLNNSETSISAANASYSFGMLGRVNDEQDEGTNNAIRALITDASGEFRPLSDSLGCHPSGACANYLRMTVESAALIGDFNGNGQLDAVDIDMLSSQFRRAPDDRSFDLNNDKALTQTDRAVWVHDLASTYFGDANLDGEFNSSDLTTVFQAGEYEDYITLNSTWAEGDWNGDGDFDSGDLVAAFQDGGYELGPKAAVSAVPEPSSAILLLVGCILVGRYRTWSVRWY